MNTVVELFRRLEAQGIAYAVLRNYEELPELRISGRAHNTDIDLVVASGELPEFRTILSSLAEDLDWNALSECDHYTLSQSRHHNIEIFRFYRVAPLEFLQIDVFHGFVSWGLPLMDESALLADRIYDAQRGLTRIHPVKENTYRLIQLHSLGHSDRIAEKIGRYRAKVLDAYARQPAEYVASVRKYFGLLGLAAVRALEKNRAKNFSTIMRLVKTWFAIRFTVRHPVHTLRFVYQRILDHSARFSTHQCGARFRVHADTAAAREEFVSMMDLLARLNAFQGWLEKSGPGEGFTAQERAAMERGAMVIQWSSRENADMVFVRGESSESIASKIVGCALDRHTLLQWRPALMEAER